MGLCYGEVCLLNNVQVYEIIINEIALIEALSLSLSL